MFSLKAVTKNMLHVIIIDGQKESQMQILNIKILLINFSIRNIYSQYSYIITLIL